MDQNSTLDAEDDDMLRGTAEIANYRREKVRRTSYLLEQGMLPAFKIGNSWYMRKSTHRAHVARLEAEAMAKVFA